MFKKLFKRTSTVYVISTGSQHEGGSVSCVFLNKKVAMKKFRAMCKEAKERTIEHHEWNIQRHIDDYKHGTDEYSELIRKEYKTIEECLSEVVGTLEDTLEEKYEYKENKPGNITYYYSCDYISFEVFEDVL